MDETLRARLLPAVLICKNFIEGMDDCNYEIYLRELVNASSYFRTKSNGLKYEAPKQEAHGECDCISESYELDFKLIASKTALQARRLFSDGIRKTPMGDLAFGIPQMRSDNPRYKPISATRIFAALRSLSLSELKTIRKNDVKKPGVEADIKALLETLETKKNVLLFFPYVFSTEKEYDVTADIIEAISHDFTEAFKYRNEAASPFDTYLTFLYDGYFVIAVVDENKLRFVDKVEEMSCPTYMKFKSYVEY